MKIVIIDGQGGGVGMKLVEGLRAALPQAELVAVGTNSIATAAMLRAGATAGATGENATVVNCRDADVITGPLGIVLADAMYGEITPEMAWAVARSGAQRVLVPVEKCRTHVAGLPEKTMAGLIGDAVSQIVRLCRE